MKQVDKNDFLTKQSGYFDEYAQSLESKEQDEQNIALQIEYKTILDIFGDLKGKKILDLGCGTGRYALKLAEQAQEVIGMDVSTKSIDFAQSRAKKLGLSNFKGIITDFKETDFEGYFDFVLCVNMLHHTDNIDLILSNIKKSLKKGGKLIIFENNPLNILFIPFFIKLGQFKVHMTSEYLRSNIFTLKKILKNNGFEIKTINRYAYLPTMLYNYSLIFQKINDILNKIPLINIFTAFHILEVSKK